MPTPIRALTNDYRCCKLVRLDSKDPKSPLIVSQKGYAPNDGTCRMRMFYLQRDGVWIDEIARSTRPESETGDVVFANSAEALHTLTALFGKPRVRELPVTDGDVQKFMDRVKGNSPEELLRQFLGRYSAAKGKS